MLLNITDFKIYFIVKIELKNLTNISILKIYKI